MDLCLMRETISRAIGATLLGAFLFAIALAVAPELHERIHPSSAGSTHECAVTLVANGSYEHSAAPQLVVAPQPAQPGAALPPLALAFVPASFLGASIFEHAPPALS
jgi:hypothetical protein